MSFREGGLYMKKKIIFFDGQCMLCDQFVLFTLSRSKEKVSFYYATLQGKTAQRVGIAKPHVDAKKWSVYYMDAQGKLHDQSDAVLLIVSQLRRLGWVKIFFIIPRIIRNQLYRLVANNRYAWFGKKDVGSLEFRKDEYFLD